MNLRRLLRRIREAWPDDPHAAKEMAQLGAAAFGPKCPVCWKRDWRGMAPRHYAYANRISKRINGKPLCFLAGLCQCRPGETATPESAQPL